MAPLIRREKAVIVIWILALALVACAVPAIHENWNLLERGDGQLMYKFAIFFNIILLVLLSAFMVLNHIFSSGGIFASYLDKLLIAGLASGIAIFSAELILF